MFGCLQKHENENVVHQIDKTEGHSLLYWSTSSSSDTLCKYIIDSHEMNADELFDGLYGCCTWGNATALKLLMPLAESRCKSQNKSIETFINKRIIDGKTLLIQASCRGDTRTVDYLSKFHAHHKLVQIPDTIFGGNALHWSSAKGNESVVKALLELDSNVNSTNEFGLSALYLASQNGHAEVAFVLITNGADVNAQIESHQFTLDDEPYGPSYNRRLHPDKGYTPLHAACEEGHKDVVKLLLHFGAKKDLLSATGKSPLHAAACDGRHEAMECLLAAGDDVNRKWLEATPFDAAFACGQGSVIDVLLKREKGNNDFHILASTGNIGEIVSSNKININVQTRDKYTALHLAAFKGHQDVVEQLVQLGADCNSTSSFGFTPIFGSAISGFYGITKLLLDQGANARHQDIQGDNIVHYSSYHGHEDIVKILIEAGASVNQKGLFERTPLAWACLKGNYKVIKILLENGANENETDSEGWTALHVSAFFGYAEVVHILLQAGADPNSSGPGFTPLHAVSLGQIDNVRTPLQFAACAHLPSNDFAKGHIAIVSDLLECEANVNALNENEDIPLHIACKRGSHEMVKLLLSGKSETNKMNKDRKTPKDIAESKEYYDIVKLIDNFQK